MLDERNCRKHPYLERNCASESALAAEMRWELGESACTLTLIFASEASMPHARYAAASLFAAALLIAPVAQAVPITWTTWSPAFIPNAISGSAVGTMGAVNVGYTGELENLLFGY